MFPVLIKLGIKTWLKTICKKIDIKKLYIKNKNSKNLKPIYEIKLIAEEIIYKNFYINKIIINTTPILIKLKFKNRFSILKDFEINALLELNKYNLRLLIFNNAWKNIKLKLEKFATEGNNIIDLSIRHNLIIVSFFNKRIKREIGLRMYLRDNNIYLKDEQGKKMKIPFDKNIRLNSLTFLRNHLNIEITSKVIVRS